MIQDAELFQNHFLKKKLSENAPSETPNFNTRPKDNIITGRFQSFRMNSFRHLDKHETLFSSEIPSNKIEEVPPLSISKNIKTIIKEKSTSSRFSKKLQNDNIFFNTNSNTINKSYSNTKSSASSFCKKKEIKIGEIDQTDMNINSLLSPIKKSSKNNFQHSFGNNKFKSETTSDHVHIELKEPNILAKTDSQISSKKKSNTISQKSLNPVQSQKELKLSKSKSDARIHKKHNYLNQSKSLKNIAKPINQKKEKIGYFDIFQKKKKHLESNNKTPKMFQTEQVESSSKTYFKKISLQSQPPNLQKRLSSFKNSEMNVSQISFSKSQINSSSNNNLNFDDHENEEDLLKTQSEILCVSNQNLDFNIYEEDEDDLYQSENETSSRNLKENKSRIEKSVNEQNKKIAKNKDIIKSRKENYNLKLSNPFPMKHSKSLSVKKSKNTKSQINKKINSISPNIQNTSTKRKTKKFGFFSPRPEKIKGHVISKSNREVKHLCEIDINQKGHNRPNLQKKSQIFW